jgi:hypothetical protein
MLRFFCVNKKRKGERFVLLISGFLVSGSFSGKEKISAKWCLSSQIRHANSHMLNKARFIKY